MKTKGWIIIAFVAAVAAGICLYLYGRISGGLPEENQDSIGRVYVRHNRPADELCEVYIDGKIWRYEREALLMPRGKRIDGFISGYSKEYSEGLQNASNFLAACSTEDSSVCGWPYILSGKSVKVYFKGGWHIFWLNHKSCGI